MTLQEMLAKRAKLVAEARALVEQAKAEDRDLTAEEKEQYDRKMDEVEKLRVQVEEAQATTRRQQRLEAEEEWSRRGAVGRQTAPGPVNDPARGQEAQFTFRRRGREQVVQFAGATSTPQYQAAFRRYLIGGAQGLVGTGVSPMFDQEHMPQIAAEHQADNDVAGGFLVGPQQFVARLIKAVDDLTFMRQICNVLPPIGQAASLGIPTLTTNPNDADWTPEIKTATNDANMAFGARELRPDGVSKLVKLSKKLLRAAVLDPEAIVRDRLAYIFAITFEKAYLNGTGARQPLGIFTASPNGIPTTRDVATANQAATPTFDGLKEAKYTLKGQYWTNAAWVCHRDFIKKIDMLKDGEGRYIWQASTIVGQPDRLLNFPVYMSEFAPNTFSANAYVAVLGDFDNYWIVDSLALTIQVLLELFSLTNQNGYVGRAETDGAPVLAEAFVRVKLAAA